MKKAISMLLSSIMVLGLFTGCGKSVDTKDVNADTTKAVAEEEETSESNAEPVEVKIWHDGDESIMQTIQDSVNNSLKEKNITVSFEKKSGLTDQLQLYGNDEANGPDMYFYAHDSLGMFVEMGILSPITDVISKEDMSELIPMTVEAGTYKDNQYLLPVYFETLLFMYNKDLWKGEVPGTTDELLAYMKENTDESAGTYAVVNQHSTAYNVAPFINGFGGYIIDKDANPGLNEKATMDAITYNKQFAKLEADGDYNTVTTLFNEGKAAAIIGGPWLISGISEAGINLGIKSLADIKLPNGNGLAPYSGVQGIGVMKHAVENKKEAMKEVLKVMAGKELAIKLANTANCAPANEKAYEDADVALNEMIVAMKATAETAQPMPNIPQMSVMWGPTESLLAAVNKSDEAVTDAANNYQQEALSAIKDMQ